MNLRSIDLNLLPVFEVVYAERSLTRASEVLHVTQPAVSNALARLRVHFEDPLFVRDGRGVKPTAMAEALMPSVRDALDRLRDGLEPRSVFEPSSSTRMFNISVSDTGAYMLAPKLVERLRAEAAGVRVNWFEVPRRSISTELASGRLDLAIDLSGIRGADLERHQLLTIGYTCVVAGDHPMANKKLTMEAYAGLHHIVVSRRREGRSYVEEVARTHNSRITPVMRTPHYMSALEIVQRTDLVLTAPRAIVAGSGLVELDIEAALPGLEMDIYWHRAKSDDPGLNWLTGIIREAADAL